MTKISIHGEIEFVPDEAGVREAKLLDLIDDHMGKDMRAVMAEYICAPESVAELEDENYSLKEQLDELRERVAGLEDALEEARWNRS